MSAGPLRVLAISPPRPGPWLDQLAVLADAGVDRLVLRLVDQPDALAAVLARLRRAPPPPGLGLSVRPVVADDVDRALCAGSGLHLPGRWSAALPAAAHAPDLALGMSCHNATQLAAAKALGATYALLSPVFSPGSKPGDSRPTLGLAGLAAGCAATDLPVLALGGVSADRAAACLAAGAAGIAGISAFFHQGQVNEPGAHSVAEAISTSR